MGTGRLRLGGDRLLRVLVGVVAGATSTPLRRWPGSRRRPSAYASARRPWSCRTARRCRLPRRSPRSRSSRAVAWSSASGWVGWERSSVPSVLNAAIGAGSPTRPSRSCVTLSTPRTTSNGQPFVFRPRPKRPRIWIGGAAPHALDRAARLGDGWMPLNDDPKEIEPAAKELGARYDDLDGFLRSFDLLMERVEAYRAPVRRAWLAAFRRLTRNQGARPLSRARSVAPAP